MKTPRQMEDDIIQDCADSFISWLPEFSLLQLIQINAAVAIALEEYKD